VLTFKTGFSCLLCGINADMSTGLGTETASGGWVQREQGM